ncbi:MAG: YceI family protein [Cytophagaceae bacterium]|nr:YceI family protein [Cytophagaceae bacterium]
MKEKTRQFKNYILMIIAIIFISAAAFIKNTYTLTKDYAITIHGTSNLHEWDEKVEIVSGNAEVIWNTDKSFDLNKIDIRFNVKSIISEEGSIMNHNTYKALKADNNPDIIFTLTNPIEAIKLEAHEKSFTVKANLTIAGVTKPIDMQVHLFMEERRKMTFEGSKKIKMTDYGIEPPTALLGTLKTGDEVTIHFKTNFMVSN